MQIPKLHRPCCFYIKCLLQNAEQNPKMCCTSMAFSQDEQSVVTCVLVMRGEGWWKCGVSSRPGMLTEDKVPAWQQSLPPRLRQASDPEPSRSGGLVLSHKSQCQSQGSRHAATCLCLYVQLCVKVLSLTHYICVTYSPFTAVLLLLHSVL